MDNSYKDYVVVKNKLVRNNIVREVDSFHQTKEDAAKHAHKKNIEDQVDTYNVHLTKNAIHDSSIHGWPTMTVVKHRYSKVDLNKSNESFEINYEGNSTPESESNKFEDYLRDKYPRSDVVRHSDTRFTIISPNGKKIANIETTHGKHIVEVQSGKYDIKHTLSRSDYNPDNQWINKQN